MAGSLAEVLNDVFDNEAFRYVVNHVARHGLFDLEFMDEGELSEDTNSGVDSSQNTDPIVVRKKFLHKNLVRTKIETDESEDEQSDEKIVKKKQTRKNRRKKLSSISEEIENSLPPIPIEIISFIMDRVDGQTLANCCLVSDTWRLMASSSTNYGSKRWLDVCLYEIPEMQFFDLLDHIEPKYWMEETPALDFFHVYNKWSHWSKFIEMNKKKKKICTLQNAINYIKTSGDWLLISTTIGGIYAYSFSKHTITPQIVECGNVRTMHLRCIQVSGQEEDGMLHGVAHDELVINLDHTKYARVNLHNLKVTRLDKLTWMNQDVSFENVEITLLVKGKSTLFKATFMDGRIVKKKFGSVCSLIHVWNGFVVAFCHISFKMMILDYEFNEVKHDFNDMSFKHKPIFPSNFFGLDTFLTLPSTPNSPCPLQVNHLNCERMYEWGQIPHVTCARLYGSHLFLGTTMGSLFIYRIDAMGDLLKLDALEKDRCEVINISSQGFPIVGIEVLETKDKSSLLIAVLNEIIEISF